jgi:hypothetical protein
MPDQDTRSKGEKRITKALAIVALSGFFFVGAKLAEGLDRPWWLVRMPLYGALALGAVAGLFIGVAHLLKRRPKDIKLTLRSGGASIERCAQFYANCGHRRPPR